MIIEFAEEDDIDAISRIEGECFIDSAWTKKMIEDDFYNRSKYIVTRDDMGEPVGYLSMMDLEIEGEVLRIAVKKQYRRKGVATKMMRFLIEYLREKYYQKLFLEVKSSNIEAIKLYERLGFVKYGERKNYYAENEDALNYVLVL